MRHRDADLPGSIGIICKATENNLIRMKTAVHIHGSGLWLKGQASYGRKVPRKLIRKAAVIMAYLRCKSSGKSGQRRVWGQRPGQPGSRCALSIYVYLMSES